jgi:hypothetical protein
MGWGAERVGESIADTYRLEAHLGRRLSGDWFRARHQALDRPVTVALFQAAGDGDDPRLADWRARAELSHPSLVPISDCGRAGDALYLVVGPIGDSSFAELVTEPQPWKTLLPMAEALLGGVGALHDRGLALGAVAPEQIVLSPDDPVAPCKLIPLAPSLDPAGAFGVDYAFDARFISPEAASGREIGPASDIYVLGCLLYAAIAGKPPFAGDSAIAILTKQILEPPPPLPVGPDLPPNIPAVVMRMLAKAPDERYASTGEVADALAGSAPTAVVRTALIPDGGGPRQTFASAVVRFAATGEAGDVEVDGLRPGEYVDLIRQRNRGWMVQRSGGSAPPETGPYRRPERERLEPGRQLVVGGARWTVDWIELSAMPGPGPIDPMPVHYGPPPGPIDPMPVHYGPPPPWPDPHPPRRLWIAILVLLLAAGGVVWWLFAR